MVGLATVADPTANPTMTVIGGKAQVVRAHRFCPRDKAIATMRLFNRRANDHRAPVSDKRARQ